MSKTCAQEVSGDALVDATHITISNQLDLTPNILGINDIPIINGYLHETWGVCSRKVRRLGQDANEACWPNDQVLGGGSSSYSILPDKMDPSSCDEHVSIACNEKMQLNEDDPLAMLKLKC
ncbi:hypothetical protein VNO78_14140 [Psophocarpus tetragonolobus]|uniref:Uncharacterized protein n=1 Tax=Psophocarpus tetragonolobus TaxID=3891 RepID=A0AAN9SRY3_PSOTE